MAGKFRERIAGMSQPPDKQETQSVFSGPEEVLTCFFNSLFGHTRNWPRAYSCLAPDARERFGAERGILTFADYWDDKLSFLEELVKARHGEYAYTHRTCFSLDSIRRERLSAEAAFFAVELVENHVARDRLMIIQRKKLSRHGKGWLLANGELEGSLDDIIKVKSPGARPLFRDPA